MNNDQGYCGFADWPPCADLATTGFDPAVIILIAGVLLLAGAIAIITGRRR